jgi:signal transduction histidine kinase
MLLHWLKCTWRAFQGSFDSEEMALRSHPVQAAIAVGASILVSGAVAWLAPSPMREQYGSPWPPVALFAIGGCCTILTWRQRARGNLAAACTLLDTAFYVAGLSLAMVKAGHPLNYVFGIALGLMLATTQGRDFSLTPLIAIAALVPSIGIVALGGGEPTNYALAASACIIFIFRSADTGHQRAAAAEKERLRSALGTADQLAADSMEMALATTLLNIGDLLHELRNAQTVVSMSLEYLLDEEGLNHEQRGAVEAALNAQKRGVALVGRTLDDLRCKARPRRELFGLAQLVRETGKNERSLALVLDEGAERAGIFGNPDHLRIVLHNLMRNARQAGATELRISARPEPSAEKVVLELADNGKGLPQEVLGSLFTAFSSLGKQEGTGLGLYLVRRCVELLHGRIEGSNGPNGGAVFRMTLPGKQTGTELASQGGQSLVG